MYRWSDGSYLEDQDFWRLSGIFRNVYLFSTPQVHIRDFFVKGELDDNYCDAVLEVITRVKNFSGEAVKKPVIEAGSFTYLYIWYLLEPIDLIRSISSLSTPESDCIRLIVTGKKQISITITSFGV